MCKTCIFRTDGDALPLRPGGLTAIKHRLLETAASHQCHTTIKTCYGALEFQAQFMYAIRMIAQPTVDCLLDEAKKILEL